MNSKAKKITKPLIILSVVLIIIGIILMFVSFAMVDFDLDNFKNAPRTWYHIVSF